MSDVPTTAPTAAPTPEAPKPHHSANQPRTPEGQFSGAPVAGQETPAAAPPPPKPKAWKLGDREVTNPDDLYAEAMAARAEREAIAEFNRRTAEAEAKAKAAEEKLKNKHALLTPEEKRAMLLEEARAWEEEQKILSMPPEQQRLVRMHQELERQRAALEAEKAERARKDQEAKEAQERAQQEAQDKALREELTAHATASLKASGLPENAANYLRVANVIRGGLVKGVHYPAEVIGARVAAQARAERAAALQEATIDDLLSDSVVAKLEALEDPAKLRKLAKLGEKLRRLNLSERGLTPEPVRTPTPGAAINMDEVPKKADGSPDWERHIQRKLRG